MKYSRKDAKTYARKHMRGIWAAASTPFVPGSLKVDEDGLRANIRHWLDDLKIDGLFVAGKQGEFFSMSIEERKRIMKIAVEETQATKGRSVQTVLSVSDQNLDTLLDLARYAQESVATTSSSTRRCCTSTMHTTNAAWSTTSTSPRRSTSAWRCGVIPTAAT